MQIVTKIDESASVAKRPVGKIAAPYRQITVSAMEMAEKLAFRHNTHNVFDFIELTDEYGVFEISAPESWKGKTIRQLDVRNKYGANILAIKYENGTLNPLPSPDYVFEDKSHIVVACTNATVRKLAGKA